MVDLFRRFLLEEGADQLSHPSKLLFLGEEQIDAENEGDHRVNHEGDHGGAGAPGFVEQVFKGVLGEEGL